jgi:type II secretory pathway pseudopilin PulG
MVMKSKKGISLIALIITIIVIIILAAIVIGVALNTPESANRAKFASALSEVQHGVAKKLAENYNQYVTNPSDVDLNEGFTRVPITNAPESFDGFAPENGETGTIGYLVNLDTIGVDQLSIGQGYKNSIEVIFGETDAFVYDEEGEVFYPQGHKYQDETYYSLKDLDKPSNNNGSENPGGENGGGEEEPPVIDTEDPIFVYGANDPEIYTGMIKTRWNASRVEIDENNAAFGDDVWYDYIAQTKDTAAGAGRSRNQ